MASKKNYGASKQERNVTVDAENLRRFLQDLLPISCFGGETLLTEERSQDGQ
jgi:hypothetical protein